MKTGFSISLIRRPAMICGAAFLLLLFLSFCLPPGALWITDNGNKYMMMRNFDVGNGMVIPHPVPELFPTGGFHFHTVEDGAVSFYPEYLSFITQPFYRLFGERGILFWPFIGTLLLLWLYCRHFRGPPLAMLLGTPLIFYSLLLWEMTPSVTFALGGFILLRKKHFFTAGVAIGLGLFMREELYFAAGAAAGALLFTGDWRGMLKFLGGFLSGAMPVWIWQYCSCGHILGLHGKFYHTNNNAGFSLLGQLKVAGWNFYHHILRFDGFEKSSWNYLAWSAGSLAAAGLAPGFRSWIKIKIAALLIFYVSVAVLSIAVWNRSDPVYAAAGATGLFATVPLAAGFLINIRSVLRERRWRIWGICILLYIVAVPPVLTAADIGLVWGSRHFLVILPLLFYLSFSAFRRSRLLPWFYVGTALAIFIQLYGLTALYRVSNDNDAVEKALLKEHYPIVTDVFYLPEQTPEIFFKGTVLQVRNIAEVKKLCGYFRAQNIRSFTLVLSPRFRQLPDPVLAELLKIYPPAEAVRKHTGKYGFPDLLVVRCGR